MSNLYVKEFHTNKVISTVDVDNKSPEQVEKVMLGMLRNMNTDKFYIDDSEIEGNKDEAY